VAVFLSIQHDLFAPFSLRRDTWRVLCGLLRSLSRPCCYVDVRWQRWWAVVGGGGCDLRQVFSRCIAALPRLVAGPLTLPWCRAKPHTTPALSGTLRCACDVRVRVRTVGGISLPSRAGGRAS